MLLETANKYSADRFSIAPMLNWTDRHCRYFHRLLAPQLLLHTEMVTANSIIHSKKDFLHYNQEEHPIAIQLGGSNPDDLAFCAELAQKKGYDEINLNVGCPSRRVQNGIFGACLMKKAGLVAQCIAAMKEKVNVPVTIKTRTGIDDQDSYDFLANFVKVVSEEGGCEKFIIHARKAWLGGLSPKKNREIPPLDYSKVYKLKNDFSHLKIVINGGVKTLDEAVEHLYHLDGVMMGREAYKNPYTLTGVDQKIFGVTTSIRSRSQVVRDMYPYIDARLCEGSKLAQITRHMIGLFRNEPGAGLWRRKMSEEACRRGAGIEVVESALVRVLDKLEI